MTFRPKLIVPLGSETGYLNARRLAAGKGMKLPSNVLHDDYLVRTDHWIEVRNIYPAWASEILVYPERNGSFRKGRDVVDSETGWIVPASYIPREAAGRKGVGLLLVPGDIEEKGKVVIHPAETPVILTSFIQENCGCGRVDEATGVPLAVPEKTLAQLPTVEKRWLYRIAGTGVRPVSRDGNYVFDHRQYVGCICKPDSDLGVAVENSEGGDLSRDLGQELFSIIARILPLNLAPSKN